MWPHRWQPTRLPRPWDSPGKNVGVGCHSLLQCMKMKSESEVTQLCLTLSDPMDCSPPGSSIHGIFQPRVLEWGAIDFDLVPFKSTSDIPSCLLLVHNPLAPSKVICLRCLLSFPLSAPYPAWLNPLTDCPPLLPCSPLPGLPLLEPVNIICLFHFQTLPCGVIPVHTRLIINKNPF